MQINKKIVLIMIPTLAVIFVSVCEAQTIESITKKELREWFLQQLWWVAIATIILGVLVAFIVRRFDVKAPALHTNRIAQIVFAVALFLILLAIPLVLWAEAYLKQPFGRPLSWSSYFSLVVKDIYTGLILIFSAVVFYLVVMLCTRVIFGTNCDCRYAFLPKFKRANK